MINRITKNTEVKGYAYDKNGKLICSVYDSGFRSVDEVIKRLKEKGLGWLKIVESVNIVNLTQDASYWYRKEGGKFKRF